MRFVLICFPLVSGGTGEVVLGDEHGSMVPLVSAGTGEVVLSDEHGSMLQSVHKMKLSTVTSRETDKCWVKAHWRGVGSLPPDCGEDMEKKGAFCYEKCVGDTVRGGLDCWSKCPNGWRNTGAHCRKAEYGRGVGFYRKTKCEDKFGGGKCTWRRDTLKWYQKCKEGWYAAGCCVCRPKKFKCSDYGLGHQIDISCHKKKIWTSLRPKIPNCHGGLVRDAGLCYKPCKEHYSGVGPVCWQKPPPGFRRCGPFLMTRTGISCGGTVTSMTTSVLTAILTVGSSGAGKLLPLLDPLKFPKLHRMVRILDSYKIQIKTFVTNLKLLGDINDVVQILVEGFQSLMELEVFKKMTRKGCKWVKAEDFGKGIEVVATIDELKRGFSILGLAKAIHSLIEKPNWYGVAQVVTSILAAVDPTGVFAAVNNFMLDPCPDHSVPDPLTNSTLMPDKECGEAAKDITKQDLDQIQETPSVDDEEILAMEVEVPGGHSNNEWVEASSNIMLASLEGPRKCLQPSSDGGSARLEASKCDRSRRQQFVWNSAGLIYSSNASTDDTKMCLDIPEGKCSNGNTLTLWPCDPETEKHSWKYVSEENQIESILCPEYCVDVYTDDKVKLHKCWGGPNQKFDRPLYAPTTEDSRRRRR